MTQKTEHLGRRATQRSRRSTREPISLRLQERIRPIVASTVAPGRRPPKLRRTFPPLKPEREGLLRERNLTAFAADPRRAELERRLLELGGTLALLFLPDPQIGELLDRGGYFPGAGSLMWRGLPSACHTNAAMMLVQTRGSVRIAFGYALSTDGLWRQHSWGVDAEDGRIIETTERRVRYYGLILNDDETLLRLLAEIQSGDLWPEEREEMRRFILQFYRLPADLVDHITRPREASS
jgi:hypothetical protein